MAVKIIRVVFILSCCIMGAVWAFYLVPYLHNGEAQSALILRGCLVGAISGFVFGLLVLFLLRYITQETFEHISPALIAVALALVTGYCIGQFVFEYYLPNVDSLFKTFTILTLVLVFGSVGSILGLTHASNWESLIRAVHRRGLDGSSLKIVDTSVIIDGRISDICQTGFIEGTLLVPRFVLKELQNIADSSDVLRRARGRRGLDILKEMQDSSSCVKIHVIEDDPSDVDEVDGKLVKVARAYGAKILTNDLNLNKVAQIDGVEVLNVNDLANALKPAVLPDEMMEVRIVKQGKEALQGVGYLDDGTMVVVDGGRDYVGRDVMVIVTSVLQTSAGRMIFSKLQNLMT